MKFCISVLSIALMASIVCVAFALRSTGRDCYGTFSGILFEGKSDDNIIEEFVWKGTNTIEPWIESLGYQDAKILGKIRAYQETFGRGLVGVLPNGSVSGPDFSMTLPPEFNMRNVTVISGTWDRTSMSTKNIGMTDEPGTYTVNGSAEIMAVKGAGGITVVGAGLSGTIGVNLRKSLRLDKHLSIGMVIETVLYLVP